MKNHHRDYMNYNYRRCVQIGFTCVPSTSLSLFKVSTSFLSFVISSWSSLMMWFNPSIWFTCSEFAASKIFNFATTLLNSPFKPSLSFSTCTTHSQLQNDNSTNNTCYNNIYVHTIILPNLPMRVVVKCLQSTLVNNLFFMFFWLQKVFANMWFDHMTLEGDIGWS